MRPSPRAYFATTERSPGDPSPDRELGSGGGGSRRALPGWLTAIALGLWLILVPLVCGEIGLRQAWRVGILGFDTEMWRYAREMKRASDRPGVVLEHRPNAAATLMGVRLETDGRGFRRPGPALEAMRTGHEPVVAVLGDSCALGWGVPEGATMAEDLERLLNTPAVPGRPRVAVVNAGVGNSNTAMEYARYVQDLRPLHPKWVILAFFINDAEPDPIPGSSPLLERSVLFATLGTRLPTLLSSTRRDYHAYYAMLYTPGSGPLERFEGAMRALGTALKQDGVSATILLIPEMHEPRDFGPFAAIYGHVAELAGASGFEVVDPSQAFPPGSGEAFWVTPGDSHPNVEAHARFAAALARTPTARSLVHAGP